MVHDILGQLPNNVRGSAEKELHQLASNCRNYLAGTSILDGFGSDHDARRKYRGDMIRQHGEEMARFYKSDKLRLNSIAGVYSHLQTISAFLRIFTVQGAEADAIRALERQLPDLTNYGDLPNEGKLSVVRQMEEVATAFLALVGG